MAAAVSPGPAAAEVHAGHEKAEPSNEPLVLARARSNWVTGVAAALSAIMLVSGLLMLRRPAHST